MKKSKRLLPVLRLSALLERRQAQRVNESSCAVRESEERLKALETYRREYQEGNYGVQAGPAMALGLGNYHSFLGRLFRAVDMEKRDMDEALRNLEQDKSRWLEAHGRNRALKSLEEHYDQMEKVAAERRVQREIDDRAGTRASNTDPWKA